MDNQKNLALFCDFENIALGVRDENDAVFDVQVVLERLLLKGTIVTKKAYCDWQRYKQYVKTLHEAAFELIEVPHVKISGKNSADIRLVVDALDLCYTKEHIDTFVIISGDSDFSPLVSKLRENAKTVVGVGVRNSSSDLLIANCDEFIFYDDLVASVSKKRTRRKTSPKKKTVPKKSEPKTDPAKEAIDEVLDTMDALYSERGERSKLWGSMIKQTIKRRKPEFDESRFGFSSFSDLLEEAQDRGLIGLELDERSGGYIVRSLS